MSRLPLILFFSLVILYLISSPGVTPYNYFILLADAFSNGRIYLTDNPSWLNELIPAGDGQYYVPYPPLPAIVLVPFVVVFGAQLQQQIIAHFAGVGISYFSYVLARRNGLSIQKSLFIMLTVGLSSIVWFMASQGSVWYLGQLAAALFLTLALAETFGKRRPLLIGLMMGAAYLSRVHTISALVFFLFMLRGKNIRRDYLLIFLGVLPFLAFNAAYNYVRFGVPYDIGYALIPGVLAEPWYEHGLLHYSYIPGHLKEMFFSLPARLSTFPYLAPKLTGLSIILTTPLFLFTLFARDKGRVVSMSWASVMLISIPIFLHGTTGFAQFGYRFAVDFYPFLILLLIIYFRKKPITRLHLTLLVLGVIVNVWGVFTINKFGLWL